MSYKKGRLHALDDEARTATFVLTTDTTDRDGETVDPSGGDFDDYNKNPVVAFNHDTDDFPIGRCLKLWTEEIGGKPALLGKVQFSKANPKGELAYQMTKEGTLTGCSISFLPQGNPEKNGNGGNHYPRWKLLEWSICPVGSNPDAIKLCLKRFKSSNEISHDPDCDDDYVGGMQNAYMFDPENVRVPKSSGGDDELASIERAISWLKFMAGSEEVPNWKRRELEEVIEKLAGGFNLDADAIEADENAGDDPAEVQLAGVLDELQAKMLVLQEKAFRLTGKRL